MTRFRYADSAQRHDFDVEDRHCCPLIILQTVMRAIEKKIVTDETGQPVAVQIDYADWLEIEHQLQEANSDAAKDSPTSEPSFDQLLKDTQGIWAQGDGLEYQQRMREEWDRPWDSDN